MSADIYSLGKIMKIMLPGPRYRRIVNKCLKDDPGARPSAAELLKSLNRKTPIIPIAISFCLITLLVAGSIFYNLNMAKNREAIDTPILKADSDTVYLQKTDTVMVETPSKPSESAIKAVWDKAIKDIDPQLKFFATYNFPNPEEHKNDLDALIPQWCEHLYFSLLEIGCTEETAIAKRKELANYMRRRYREYRATKPSRPTDTLTNR